MALFTGTGGAKFDIDVASMRPGQRANHEAKIAAGELTPVEVKPKRSTVKKSDASDITE